MRKILLNVLFLIILAFIINSCGGGNILTPIFVNEITVTSENNIGAVLIGNTLQMSTQIKPETATNKELIWSVENTNDNAARDIRAEISQAGVLRALTAGTVIVKASAKDGSGVEGTKIITIMNTEPQNYTITIEASPAKGGDVSFDNAAWSDNASRTVNEHTELQIYSKTAENHSFSGWYMNNTLISTLNPFSVQITSNKIIEARFNSIPNEPPTIDKIIGVIGETNENSATFKWAATDPDGSIEHYEYKEGTSASWKITNETEHTWNGYSPGEHTFYVKAVDNKGASSNILQWTFNYSSISETSFRGITIGIVDYGGNDDLEYTDDDADDMKITFERLKNGYSMEKHTGRVTKQQLQGWLQAYSGITNSSDVFVFQFSGHGIYENGQSKIEFSDGQNMSTSELRNMLDQIDGTKIVLIDSCDSGNFTTLNSPFSSAIPTPTYNQLFTAGVINAFKESTEKRGNYNSDHEYYVLTGSNVGESSGEDDYIENGIFSFFFCDGLGNVSEEDYDKLYDGTFNADGYGPQGDKDHKLTFSELYHYSKDNVKRFVKDYYNDDQIVQANHPSSDFIIGEY